MCDFFQSNLGAAVIGAIIGAIIGLVGGCLAALVGAQYGYCLSQKNLKRNILIDTKTACDLLQKEYKQLIDDKITLIFIEIVERKHWPKVQLLTYEKQQEIVEKHSDKIRTRKETLQLQLNKISVYFKINKKQEKIINDLSHFHIIDEVFIRNTRGYDGHEGLKKWRKEAEEQGFAQLDKYFIHPHYELLKTLKEEI